MGRTNDIRLILSVCLFATFAISSQGQSQTRDSVAIAVSSPGAAMCNSRERLLRGKFRARFQQHHSKGGSIDSSFVDEVRCSFDFSQDFFRVERLPQTSQDANSTVKSLGAQQQQDFRTRIYIRNDEYSANWQPVTGIVDKKGPSEKPFAWDILRPFDPRLIGLFGFGGYTGKIFGKDDARVLLNHYANDPTETKDVSAEIVKLTWRHEDMRMSLWLDKSKRYSPVRLEHAYEKPKEFICDVGETSWKFVNDTWVPSDMFVEWRHGSDEAERLEGQFDWQSVNQEIVKSEFTIEGLNLPIGTVVRDGRAGPQFVERVIGRDGIAQVEHKPLSSNVFPLRIVMIIVTAAIIVVLALLVIRQRLRLGST
jgi:hypothetical protein